MGKEQEKSEEQQFLEKEKSLREKIKYAQADYDGLKAGLDYLRSDGAREIDTEYIVDEMDESLETIKRLKEERERLLREHAKYRSSETQGQSRSSNSEER